MKITAKTTKEELKDFLGANVKAVKKVNKDLFDRIAYADKMAKTDDSKVTRKDLADLAKEVMKLLGDKIATPVLAEETPKEAPVENSTKKLSKGVSKKQEINSEAEKPAKKSLEKKSKEGVKVLENVSNNKKALQLAETFPKTLEVGDTKYEVAEDIKTMEDLHKALGEDQEIVFAYYWNPRHLRQFSYFNGALGQPKSFDRDLDLATTIYVSDEMKICYQVSMYTEACYVIQPEDLVEENDIRVAGGIEYQIYRAV